MYFFADNHIKRVHGTAAAWYSNVRDMEQKICLKWFLSCKNQNKTLRILLNELWIFYHQSILNLRFVKIQFENHWHIC